MGYIFKLIIIGAGLAVIYGLVTGQDLNVLFANILDQAIPFAKELVRNISNFAQQALNK